MAKMDLCMPSIGFDLLRSSLVGRRSCFNGGRFWVRPISLLHFLHTKKSNKQTVEIKAKQVKNVKICVVGLYRIGACESGFLTRLGNGTGLRENQLLLILLLFGAETEHFWGIFHGESRGSSRNRVIKEMIFIIIIIIVVVIIIICSKEELRESGSSSGARDRCCCSEVVPTGSLVFRH